MCYWWVLYLTGSCAQSAGSTRRVHLYWEPLRQVTLTKDNGNKTLCVAVTYAPMYIKYKQHINFIQLTNCVSCNEVWCVSLSTQAFCQNTAGFNQVSVTHHDTNTPFSTYIYISSARNKCQKWMWSSEREQRFVMGGIRYSLFRDMRIAGVGEFWFSNTVIKQNLQYII